MLFKRKDNIEIIFCIQPDIIPVKESGDLYRLDEDFLCTFYINNSLVRIFIPKGFPHDGASVPSLLRMFMGRDGVHRAAALVHDWIYANKGNVNNVKYSKEFADNLFYSIMKYHGVKSWLAKAAHVAVRLAVWKKWD